jgi:flagellar biosynthesis/type III secretory pathway protein FliH
MSRIVIEVENQVANAFLNESSDTRERIVNSINSYLKKVFLKKDIEDYKLLLSQISEEAEKNGLTEEKLKLLLNSDD